MKTILLTSVTCRPKTGIDVDLADGYEKLLVFYPVAEGSSYLNMSFLSAELLKQQPPQPQQVPPPRRLQLRCRNIDETFEHELWIIQFNHPLPPIFKIEPWQILLEGPSA